MQQYEKRIKTIAMMNNPNIDKALKFIDENLDRPLTLSEVSNVCGMSKYHFSRVFKTVTGQTFKEHHNQRRIEEAKKLLRKDTMRITEICYEIGFNDLSYFDRLFHRATGMSPSCYRDRFHKT